MAFTFGKDMNILKLSCIILLTTGLILFSTGCSEPPPEDTSKSEFKTRKATAPIKYEFDILSDWTETQNGAEIVFWFLGKGFPQLFHQTVVKSEQFKTVREFSDYTVISGGWSPSDISETEITGRKSVVYDFTEGENIIGRSLVVDADAGFLYFYLKANSEDKASVDRIMNRLIMSLKIE